VLTNLLSNALKYAPGTKNSVSLNRAPSGHARLEVSDRGPGISATDRERVLGRFEREQDSGRISGLGIGLYISKAIVAAHGGTIMVG
jgi:signal transduction histidine kinase